MEEEQAIKNNENKNILTITIILGIVVILLIAYICFFSNLGPKSAKFSTDNHVLKILNENYIKHDNDVLIVEVQNISSTDYTNVEPLAIFYDSDNLATYFDYGETINYFEAGSTRYLSFTDAYPKYSRVEIGLLDDSYYYGDEEDDEEADIKNISKEIKYQIDEEEPDEDGDISINITGRNSSKTDADLLFQIGYYADNQLIYVDEFSIYAEAKSSFEDSFYLEKEYFDGKDFPQGYTYKIILAEAIESIDYYTYDDDYFYDYDDFGEELPYYWDDEDEEYNVLDNDYDPFDEEDDDEYYYNEFQNLVGDFSNNLSNNKNSI